MQEILFGCTLLATAFLSYNKKKLTLTATFVACIVAICIYSGTEWSGIALLGTFFILCISATAWKKKEKQKPGFSEGKNGRDAKQVLANGSTAALCALAALLFPEHEAIFLLMIACSLSSATADTISSELGVLYGRKFYNILTFKKDVRGENGVISVEGTLLGIVGSIVIALVFSLMMQQIQWSLIGIIILAGTIGNIADSVLGATLERNNLIGNNAVNFINTLVAALIGGLLA